LIYAANRDNKDVEEASIIFCTIFDITSGLKELGLEWEREDDVSVFHTLAL